MLIDFSSAKNKFLFISTEFSSKCCCCSITIGAVIVNILSMILNSLSIFLLFLGIFPNIIKWIGISYHLMWFLISFLMIIRIPKKNVNNLMGLTITLECFLVIWIIGAIAYGTASAILWCSYYPYKEDYIPKMVLVLYFIMITIFSIPYLLCGYITFSFSKTLILDKANERLVNENNMYGAPTSQDGENIKDESINRQFNKFDAPRL